MSIFANFISLLARYIVFVSYKESDLNSFLEIYSLVIRNSVISDNEFLSKLVSNSTIDRKFTQLS